MQKPRGLEGLVLQPTRLEKAPLRGRSPYAERGNHDPPDFSAQLETKSRSKPNPGPDQTQVLKTSGPAKSENRYGASGTKGSYPGLKAMYGQKHPKNFLRPNPDMPTGTPLPAICQGSVGRVPGLGGKKLHPSEPLNEVFRIILWM